MLIFCIESNDVSVLSFLTNKTIYSIIYIIHKSSNSIIIIIIFGKHITTTYHYLY